MMNKVSTHHVNCASIISLYLLAYLPSLILNLLKILNFYGKKWEENKLDTFDL